MNQLRSSPRALSVPIAFVIVLIGFASVPVQVSALSQDSVPIDLTEAQHAGPIGTPDNDLIEIELGRPILLQAFSIDGILTADQADRLEDAVVVMEDQHGEPAFTYSLAATAEGQTSISIRKPETPFSAFGEPNIPLPNGTVRIELALSSSGGSSTAATWAEDALLSLSYLPLTAENCTGDLNRTGTVDVFDLLVLLDQWGPCRAPCPADLNNSGSVDVFDLLLLLDNWGTCPPTGEVTGACCQGPGTCQETTEAACIDLGADYQGDLTDCLAWSCPLLPAECPQGEVNENEPCGEDLTGGCSASPPSFATACCGDVITGNTWADDGARDTDWYRLTVEQETNVRLRLTAEFTEPGMELRLFNDDCGSLVDQATPVQVGDANYITACLSPGSYLIVVLPGEFSGLPCPGGSYTLEVNCGEPGCENGLTCGSPKTVEINGPPVSADTSLGIPLQQDACFEPEELGVRWFRVVGNGQFLTASSCGSSMSNTHMHVFCGSCNVPNCVSGTTDDSAVDFCSDHNQASAFWCSELDRVYYVAVYGAEEEGEVQVNVESFGTCFEPPTCELEGVCQDICGFESPIGCWCDEGCVELGDCCPGRCNDCPFFPSCVDCPAVECVDSIGDPCGESSNAGCAASPPAFTAATCGSTHCGEVWAQDNERDEDWFDFEVTGSSARAVTFTVDGDFPVGMPVEIAIYSDDCDDPTPIATATSQCSATINACLAPGHYHVVVRPGNLFGMPCTLGPHRYEVTFECTGSCAPDDPFPCKGFCGGQSPQGCWCDSNCFLQGNCCDDVCDSCPDLSGCGPPPGSCAGLCLFQSPEGCWCDVNCHVQGDCCQDICQHCPGFADCP